MIEARGLVKRYGAFEAIRGVSFDVERGEIVGLLGPNGAGKTTIMKMLTCFHEPTRGTARVDSHDVRSESLEVRRSVGYLPENAPVYRDAKVVEYLRFVATVRGIPRRETGERVAWAIGQCGLAAVAYRNIGKLSKGYRQRVGLAQAIIHDPQVLILDEPTTGLDPGQIIEIRELVRSLGERKTVMLSTHILPEVELLCGRVLILNEGAIVAQGTARELAGSVGTSKTLAVVVRGRPAEEVGAALAAFGSARVVTPPAAAGDGRVSLELAIDEADAEGAVFDWAVANALRIVELTPKGVDLEQIFVRLTRREDA